MTLLSIAKSWCIKDGIHTTEELLKWIKERNKMTHVEIHKCTLEENDFWFYENNWTLT